MKCEFKSQRTLQRCLREVSRSPGAHRIGLELFWGQDAVKKLVVDQHRLKASILNAVETPREEAQLATCGFCEAVRT